MRMWAIPLLVLPLAHCSCQHEPEPTTADAAAPDAAVETAPGSAAPTDAVRPGAEVARASRAASAAAVSSLHAYLALAPGGDEAAADAYWAGGGPGRTPGDAIVRNRDDLQDMRIQNGVPVALEDDLPPRSFEIPVDLRLRTADGTRRIEGWYRLRLRIDGEGWEITSASLQPRLD